MIRANRKERRSQWALLLLLTFGIFTLSAYSQSSSTSTTTKTKPSTATSATTPAPPATPAAMKGDFSRGQRSDTVRQKTVENPTGTAAIKPPSSENVLHHDLAARDAVPPTTTPNAPSVQTVPDGGGGSNQGTVNAKVRGTSATDPVTAKVTKQVDTASPTLTVRKAGGNNAAATTPTTSSTVLKSKSATDDWTQKTAAPTGSGTNPQSATTITKTQDMGSPGLTVRKAGGNQDQSVVVTKTVDKSSPLVEEAPKETVTSTATTNVTATTKKLSAEKPTESVTQSTPKK